MSFRPSVEALFGLLRELPSHYHSEIAEEVLWTEDKLTPAGRTYRITFLFGDEGGRDYFMMDFWWVNPLSQSMIGIGVPLNGSQIYTEEESAGLLFQKIQSEILSQVDREFSDQIARARQPEMLARLQATPSWERLKPYLEEP